ncbi:MAG: carboxy-S-adenosyl-L-methionine synthase CmoA [Gammaproteobacteria bacterium]
MAGSKKDRIYASKQEKIEKFVFDDKVAGVFTDMIQRSVPGYTALNQLLPIVANQFIQENSNVYDLGCSLGEASISIANTITCSNVNIYAIDNSTAMISQLQSRLAELNLASSIQVIAKDLTEIKICNGSFAILNYTLQFIDQSKRDDLINKICSGLNKQGALLLSEKITYEDEAEELLMQKLHENYKRQNDYSELEISQKREALEDVLVRDTHKQHIKRLHKSGFSKVTVLSKYLNFVSYLAIK